MTKTSQIVAPKWLSEGPPARVLALLNRDGEQARVVGGAVRNTLLRLPPGDVDIATTALPPEVVRRATQAGLKTVPTGVEHGTVTVIVHGSPIEVTTLREDVETFGRKALVRFGRDWKADAERRDFTMNALSLSPDGTVTDYVGGLDDLAARRVRFIGDAATRIREDYLRILRFFRFHAAYGEGAPDAAGLAAAIRMRDGLRQLSRERVRAELLKLLVARGAVATLTVMADAGLMQPFIGVPLIASLVRLAAIEQAQGSDPDALVRLGVLALHVADDAARLTEALRLSNNEHARLASMGERWWVLRDDLSDQGGRALLYRLGPEAFRDRALFAWARTAAAADDSEWARFASLPSRWSVPVCPFKAADLMRLGLRPGPALGAALSRAEGAWIAADFPADPATLTALAQQSARALLDSQA